MISPPGWANEQPFFGLQALGLHDPNARPERVEEMAEHYLEEIRSLQPHGPYFLGGHSAGGLVAYEMARRLHEVGEEVALLALFDSWAPGHGQLIPEKFLRMKLEEFRERLARFSSRLRERGQFGYLGEKLRIRLRVLLGRTSTLPPNLQELQDAIEDAVDEYRPLPYAGVVTLFRAKRQPAEYAIDQTLGWGEPGARRCAASRGARAPRRHRARTSGGDPRRATARVPRPRDPRGA